MSITAQSFTAISTTDAGWQKWKSNLLRESWMLCEQSSQRAFALARPLEWVWFIQILLQLFQKLNESGIMYYHIEGLSPKLDFWV